MAAAPVFRSKTTGVLTAGTSFVINKPLGVVDGDVLWFVFYPSRSGSAPTVTTLAGWNFVGAGTQSTTEKVWVYNRVASSEGASYTWAVSPATDAIGTMLAYTGQDLTTPLDVALLFTGATTSTSMVAPSVTTATDNAQLLTIYATNESNPTNGVNSTPAGMTEQVDFAQSSNLNLSLAVDEQTITPAGATGTRTSIHSVSINASISISFALRPAATSLPPQSLIVPQAVTRSNFY